MWKYIVGIAYLAGVASGVFAHDRFWAGWNWARDSIRHAHIERVNDRTTDDQSGINEKAAQSELAIADSGTDALVSVRLECLFRFPDGKGISKCVQKLMPKPEALMPAAEAPPHGE